MEVEVNLSTLQHKICGYYCATICKMDFVGNTFLYNLCLLRFIWSFLKWISIVLDI